MRMVAAPFRIDNASAVPARAAPELGEHTADVLVEVGFSAAEVDAMEAEGVVGARPQGALAKWMQRHDE